MFHVEHSGGSDRCGAAITRVRKLERSQPRMEHTVCLSVPRGTLAKSEEILSSHHVPRETPCNWRRILILSARLGE